MTSPTETAPGAKVEPLTISQINRVYEAVVNTGYLGLADQWLAEFMSLRERTRYIDAKLGEKEAK